MYQDEENFYDDDDDEYDDYHNYDDNDQYDPYKFSFKFDVSSEWFQKLFNDIYYPIYISAFPVVSIPVNDYFSNAASGYQTLLYLGNNQYGEKIYKYPNKIMTFTEQQYKEHLQSHAKHFILQPMYYKGLFDILN